MWQGVSGRYRKGVSSIFSPDPAYQKLASEMDPTHVRMGAKVVFDLFDHQIHDKGRLISVFNRHNETVATDSRPPFPEASMRPAPSIDIDRGSSRSAVLGHLRARSLHRPGARLEVLRLGGDERSPRPDVVR